MARPAITVAMSVHNSEPYLAESVASVIGQSFADFEFLVLDDGSKDASPARMPGSARFPARNGASSSA